MRREFECALPHALFLEYLMDSTATNKAARRILRHGDGRIIVIPCQAHAFSLVLKHTAKNVKWVNDVHECSCPISEKLGNSSKLRDVYSAALQEAGSRAKSIPVHCPTRFGTRYMVMRTILKSEKALKLLSQSDTWKAAVAETGSKLKATQNATHNAEVNLFEDVQILEALGRCHGCYSQA